MGFSTFTGLFYHDHYLIPEYSLPQERNPIHWSNHYPCSPTPLQPLIDFLSLGLSILDIVYKWNNIICSLLFMASSTWCSKFIHDGTSLVVPQLRLCASTASGRDLIPFMGTKIHFSVCSFLKKVHLASSAL